MALRTVDNPLDVTRVSGSILTEENRSNFWNAPRTMLFMTPILRLRNDLQRTLQPIHQQRTKGEGKEAYLFLQKNSLLKT